MADGDRPIVLVPLATARKAARRAGVTLDLSAEDIALAGKWKHGWIPLDAVASAVKAKRYHGGGGEGRTVKGKGRAGSAVESRREPSRGRTKAAAPRGGRAWVEHSSEAVRRNNAFNRGSVDSADVEAGKFYHASGTTHVQGTSGAIHEVHHVDKGLVYTRDGRVIRAGRTTSRPRGSTEDVAASAPRSKRTKPLNSSRSEAPRRGSHISAEPMKDGRHRLTDSKSGESVKASHLASFHSQGHTITGVRNGQMHTRDDYGKAHVYDPATGRAATASASLADHARAHSEPVPWVEHSDPAVRRDNAIARRDVEVESRNTADFYRAAGVRHVLTAFGGQHRVRHVGTDGLLHTADGRVLMATHTVAADPRQALDQLLHEVRTTKSAGGYNSAGSPVQKKTRKISGHRVQLELNEMDGAQRWYVDNNGPYALGDVAKLLGVGGGSAKPAATDRAQQVAQDRHRRLEAARGGPKLADLSESDLRGLISRYGEKSVQADAARAEMLRRGQVSQPDAVDSGVQAWNEAVASGDSAVMDAARRDLLRTIAHATMSEDPNYRLAGYRSASRRGRK